MRHRLVCAAVLGGLTMAIARGGGAEPPASLDEKVRSFKDLENKLSPGACFTAHNVLDGISGVRAFLDYVKGRPGFTTRIERSSRSGVSVSCRTSP